MTPIEAIEAKLSPEEEMTYGSITERFRCNECSSFELYDVLNHVGISTRADQDTVWNHFNNMRG